MSRKDDIKKLITNHKRRLQKLKEQQASFGPLYTPPHILTDIEDTEAIVKKLETELKALQDRGVINREAPSSQTNLTYNDRQNLSAELNKLSRWQAGIDSERAVLATGLPQDTVYAFSLTGVPATDAINIIAHLENFGRLTNRPTHTALGALVEYLLNNAPDQQSQNFLADLIVRYQMIDDKEN